jgi:hypothetical protein
MVDEILGSRKGKVVPLQPHEWDGGSTYYDQQRLPGGFDRERISFRGWGFWFGWSERGAFIGGIKALCIFLQKQKIGEK